MAMAMVEEIMVEKKKIKINKNCFGGVCGGKWGGVGVGRVSYDRG